MCVAQGFPFCTRQPGVVPFVRSVCFWSRGSGFAVPRLVLGEGRKVAGASVAHRTVISAERNVILCVSDGAAPAMLPPSMHSLQPRSSGQHHLHARGPRPGVVVVLAAWSCPRCQAGAAPEVAFCLCGIAPCREQGGGGGGGGSPRVVLRPFPLGGGGWPVLFGEPEGTAESAGPAGGPSGHRT